MLGGTVEFIDGHNGKSRGVKNMMIKTKIISRPVNKVYP